MHIKCFVQAMISNSKKSLTCNDIIRNLDELGYGKCVIAVPFWYALAANQAQFGLATSILA